MVRNAWLTLKESDHLLIRLAARVAPTLLAVGHVLDIDPDTFSARLLALGLPPLRQRRGVPMPPAPEALALFLRRAGLTEAELPASGWPTMRQFRTAYLRLVLERAPNQRTAAQTLGLRPGTVSRKIKALKLPKLPRKRHGEMPPPPEELAALVQAAHSSALVAQPAPASLTTTTDTHALPLALLNFFRPVTVRWISAPTLMAG